MKKQEFNLSDYLENGHLFELRFVKGKLNDFFSDLKKENRKISPFAELDEKRWKGLLGEFDRVINKLKLKHFGEALVK